MNDAPRGRRLLAVLVGVVGALVLAEIALRVAGPRVHAPRIDSYAFLKLDDDPDRLHWGFDPDVISWHAWDGDPYDTLPPGERMNYDDVAADGLRGPPPAPDDDRPRVLFVGDSFTFGEGVAREDTFVERAGALLRASGEDVVVRNAGVPGYGAFEEALRLPALLAAEEPSAVVVVFVPNDAIHVSDAFGRDDDLLKRGGASPWAPRVWTLARRAAAGAARTGETERWYLSYYTGDARAGWDRAREALRRMRDAAEEAGAALGVVYFPLLHRLGEPPLDGIERIVREACREDGIPYEDLTEALAAEDEQALWLHPVDHHPNSRAHGIVAAPLAAFAARLLARSRR